MSFVIRGLDPAEFDPLFGLSDDPLAARGVIAKTADAEPGERVLLLNHESHKAPTPFRSSYAIYVRDGANAAAIFKNVLPPVFRDRLIALRIFNESGMLIGADMGRNGALEQKIEAALAQPGASYIHAHNAMHGCFAAEIRPDAS